MTTDENIELLERVQTAIEAPETIAEEELDRWMRDEAFMEAYQMALRTRSAMLASETGEADSAHEFQKFTKKHPQRANIAWLGALAAAACIIALFYLSLPNTQSPAPTVAEEAYLYQAVTSPDTAITIAIDGDTINLSTLARQGKQPSQQAITVQGNSINVQPADYSEYEITPSTVTVPQGKVAMLTLPDGSRVWLNANSSLIYPMSFKKGEPRRVQLKGEAYFSVTHDSSRPFIVDCQGVQTRVLGTEFDIRGYENAPCVTLVKGSVQVNKGHRQVRLRPNESVAIGPSGEMTVEKDVDVEALTCWRDNRFYFDGQSLRDIMIEIGKWYNMDVMIGSNSHINDRLHFRGERQWSIQELMEQMNMICKTQIKIEGKTLIIY